MTRRCSCMNSGEVCVPIERNFRVRMPDYLRERVDVPALHGEVRCECVPEVVKSEIVDLRQVYGARPSRLRLGHS